MKNKNLYIIEGSTMKKTMIRKIIYILTSLFLLCNFFSINNGEQGASNAFSYDDTPSITIHVPNGTWMVINTEKSSRCNTINATTKTSQIKTLSNIRFILLAFLLLIAGCLYSLRKSCISITESIYSRTFIIRFIHNKDGRKRL